MTERKLYDVWKGETSYPGKWKVQFRHGIGSFKTKKLAVEAVTKWRDAETFDKPVYGAGSEKPVRIAGQRILRVWTLGSWYDHQCVGVAYLDAKGKERTGRMSVATIAKMLNEFVFNVDLADDDTRRKYDYIVEPVRIPEEEGFKPEETLEEMVAQGLFEKGGQNGTQ